MNWESLYNFSALIKENFFSFLFLIFGEMDFSIFSPLQIISDILLVSILVYFFIKFIAKVHAFQIVITLIIFGTLLFISYSFELLASKLVLQGIFILLLVIIPLMFQQELRKTFEIMGKSPFLFLKRSKSAKKHGFIKALKQASFILAEKQHGATFVIEKNNPLHVYAETGILLNADLSKELLLNIFFPKSPLHDGAVIIRNNTVISAGSVLPLTHTPSEYMYGTRHKSAVGISEITDALAIIISEERGEVSIAYEGELFRNVTPEYLEHFLNKHL